MAGPRNSISASFKRSTSRKRPLKTELPCSVPLHRQAPPLQEFGAGAHFLLRLASAFSVPCTCVERSPEPLFEQAAEITALFLVPFPQGRFCKCTALQRLPSGFSANRPLLSFPPNGPGSSQRKRDSLYPPAFFCATMIATKATPLRLLKTTEEHTP